MDCSVTISLPLNWFPLRDQIVFLRNLGLGHCSRKDKTNSLFWSHHLAFIVSFMEVNTGFHLLKARFEEKKYIALQRKSDNKGFTRDIESIFMEGKYFPVYRYMKNFAFFERKIA
jgi:hypothetical protein